MKISESRRWFLYRSAGVISGMGITGCIGGDSETETGSENDVTVKVVHYEFDPAEVTIQSGETVTWVFEDPTHNVSGVPEHHETISIPEGSEPFASYEGDNRIATINEGGTYSHTFENPGTYVYVCIPHATSMIGRIKVK